MFLMVVINISSNLEEILFKFIMKNKMNLKCKINNILKEILLMYKIKWIFIIKIRTNILAIMKDNKNFKKSRQIILKRMRKFLSKLVIIVSSKDLVKA
jgi:hypothetical protein